MTDHQWRPQGWIAMSLATAAGCAVLLAASSAPAASGAVPANALWAAQSSGSARVIVQLAVPAKPEARLESIEAVGRQRAAIATAQGTVRAELAGTPHQVLREYSTIPFVAIQASDAALAALERSGQVVAVQQDRLLHPLATNSMSIVEADQAWGEGFDGSGQVVGIVDSGVDGTHPMLAGKLVDEACFSQGGNCPNGQTQQSGSGAAAPCNYTTDDCGHGTHVAGVAAGNWPAQNLFGVARGAKIAAVQVFSRFTSAADCGSVPPPCALAYTSDIAAGLDHIYQLTSQQPIASVNVSIGGGSYSSTSSCDADNAATKAVIDNLVSAGVGVAIAAGNDGSATSLEAPGCISSAISVGSTTAGDQISSFSDSASFLSLLAPGEQIESAFPGGQVAIGSGTSESTPHVTGAWAVLKQKSPQASVSSVLSTLRSTGLAITDPRNGVTTPRIQVRAALDALSTGGRQSGVDTTPDGKRRLISKDVGGQRWAITYDLNDLTLSGNVFNPSGGDPQFVFCEKVSDDGNPDPSKVQITYSCSGAAACESASCSEAAWSGIGNVTVPGSFLQP